MDCRRIPFEHNSTLYFIESINPYHVVQIDYAHSKNTPNVYFVQTVVKNEFNPNFGWLGEYGTLACADFTISVTYDDD